MDERKLVHEFQKNSMEKVKIELGTYNGKEIIDIRVYYKANGAQDNWLPSKKGICLRVDLIPELNLGIEKVYKKLGERVKRQNS